MDVVETKQLTKSYRHTRGIDDVVPVCLVESA